MSRPMTPEIAKMVSFISYHPSMDSLTTYLLNPNTGDGKLHRLAREMAVLEKDSNPEAIFKSAKDRQAQDEGDIIIKALKEAGVETVRDRDSDATLFWAIREHVQGRQR